MAKRWRLLFTIAFVVFALDQVTKFLAVAELTRSFQLDQAKTFGAKVGSFVSSVKLERIRERPHTVLREHLRFKYVENPGAAWGAFGGLPDNLRVPFFFGVSLVAVAAILLFYRRVPRDQRVVQVALALVLGGALGNFLDRILRGYVIDFIDLHWQNDPRLHWPTFNVADIGISVGVALLLSHTLFGRHPTVHVDAEPLPEEPPQVHPAFVELPADADQVEVAPPRRAVALGVDGELLHESPHEPEPPPGAAGDEPPGNRGAAGPRSEGAGAPTQKE